MCESTSSKFKSLTYLVIFTPSKCMFSHFDDDLGSYDFMFVVGMMKCDTLYDHSILPAIVNVYVISFWMRVRDAIIFTYAKKVKIYSNKSLLVHFNSYEKLIFLNIIMDLYIFSNSPVSCYTHNNWSDLFIFALCHLSFAIS